MPILPLVIQEHAANSDMTYNANPSTDRTDFKGNSRQSGWTTVLLVEADGVQQVPASLLLEALNDGIDAVLPVICFLQLHCKQALA